MSADRDALTITLERDLRELLHVAPSPQLRRAMSEQMRAAVEATADVAVSHRRHWPRRRSLAMLAAIIGAVALAGVVGAQALRDPNEPRPVEGVTNFGQPFWNTPLMDLTPPESHRFAVERGYSLIWQIEDRAGTADTSDDSTSFAETPPECGDVVAGALIDGVLHMVAELNAPESPASACAP